MFVDIAALVAPLIALMKSRVVSGRVLGVDDTSVRLLDPALPGKMRTARFWLYRGREDHPYNVFDEAKPNDPVAAARAFAMYRGLYDVDDRAKQCSAEKRLELRQRESAPLMSQFDHWLIEKSSDPRVLSKSSLGKAVRYWLMVGSSRGGEVAAALYSLVSSAARHDAEQASRRLTTLQRRVRRREASVA
jgi:hypothetical protein